MGRRRRPMDLVNMSNRRTPALKIFGNGSIVDTAGYKHQAEEAPSIKLQASSAKPVRQIVARQYVLLTEAPSSTNHGSV